MLSISHWPMAVLSYLNCIFTCPTGTSPIRFADVAVTAKDLTVYRIAIPALTSWEDMIALAFVPRRAHSCLALLPGNNFGPAICALVHATVFFSIRCIDFSLSLRSE